MQNSATWTIHKTILQKLNFNYSHIIVFWLTKQKHSRKHNTSFDSVRTTFFIDIHDKNKKHPSVLRGVCQLYVSCLLFKTFCKLVRHSSTNLSIEINILHIYVFFFCKFFSLLKHVVIVIIPEIFKFFRAEFTIKTTNVL